MNWLAKPSKVRDAVFIVLGTFLMALGINMIYDPMQLVTGGVSGIGIVVEYYSGLIFGYEVPLWVSTLAMNIPLFVIAFIVLDKKQLAGTTAATVLLTFFMWLLPTDAVLMDDLLLASLFGAICAGGGIGLVFAARATTGGTDLMGMIIQKKVRHLSLPVLIFIIDGTVVVAGAVVFGLEKALYAVIAVYVTSKVSNAMLEGMKYAKSIQIISDKYEEISSEILVKLDRGVTGVKSVGMYSKADKQMLVTVVSKKEALEVVDIVRGIDPAAFVIVSDVREVMGEGFHEFGE